MKQIILQQKLLNELRKNSNTRIVGIAGKIKEPVTTVFEAEKKLRKEKVIVRYLSVLNYEKLGFSIRAVYMVNARHKTRLMENLYVNNLQLLEGNYLFCDAIFSTMQQLITFEEEIKAKRMFIISVPKIEAAKI